MILAQKACCEKRGDNKLKGKENCAMFQFKEGVGCFHGKSKNDCQSWKSANKDSSRGWFGGEVNSAAMENQVCFLCESGATTTMRSPIIRHLYVCSRVYWNDIYRS